MSNRGQHLFEAFSAGGPSAAHPPASAPAPQAVSPSLSSPLLTGNRPRGLRASQWQLLILLQIVMLVVAFLLGRMSARPVAAAEPQDPPAGTGAVVETPSEPASEPQAPANDTRVVANLRAAAEMALQDRSNVYTIKVVEYADSKANQQLAAATCTYLTNTHGLPACVTITGARLYVVVGAAPDKDTLDQVRDIVRNIDGPPPVSRAREFHDAYAERIDRILKR